MVNGGGTDYNPRNTAGVHVLLKMDESTYAEDDGSDGTDDDHPISWCKKFDGGRSFYTGLGHTQASYAEAGIRSHIAAGIEIAAGVLPSAACGVAPATPGTDVPINVGGTVPTVLSLTLGPAPSLGTFVPGVAADYTASLTATVISTASSAALSVRDPDTVAPGRLVNGTRALASPLQMKVGSAAFAALSGTPLSLATFPDPVSNAIRTVDIKQSISATEPLLSGNYGKTVVFTLSSTTP